MRYLKKIVHINTTCGVGSTGGIAVKLCEKSEEYSIEAEIIYGCKEGLYKNSYCVQSRFAYIINNFYSRLFACEGKTNYFTTKKLIKYLQNNKPDILHLHNLHGHYIHCGLLFDYIKKNNIRVIWTLHDCWSFTGSCPHFTYDKCDKWKTGCYKCHTHSRYPKSYFDNSKHMWKQKKEWFTGVNDLTIVTPSKWLSNIVKQSYLGDYRVVVINNGIDLNVFKPVENDFRSKYNISDDKYILLGVSFVWGKRKGLDVFKHLAQHLDKRFQIVLVGVDDAAANDLPDNIIAIRKTNIKELAQIYTAADLFVNPTREEVLGLVNIEALACGTPVLTFNSGGSPECIDDTCGSVVEFDDVEAMTREIENICINKPFSELNCVNRAKLFDKEIFTEKYFSLYNEIYNAPRF